MQNMCDFSELPGIKSNKQMSGTEGRIPHHELHLLPSMLLTAIQLLYTAGVYKPADEKDRSPVFSVVDAKEEKCCRSFKKHNIECALDLP